MIKRITVAVFSTLTLTSFFSNAMALDKFPAKNVVLSSDKDQESIAVTIYSNNLAFIKDQRKVNLNNGIQSLVFRDVSAQIRPEQ